MAHRASLRQRSSPLKKSPTTASVLRFQSPPQGHKKDDEDDFSSLLQDYTGSDEEYEYNECKTPSRGVPLHKQKQLLQDIILLGGIKAVTFQHLVHCRRADQDFYGPPDSQERRQIRNKLYQWKRLPLNKLQALQLKLDCFSQPPALLLQAPEYRELSHLPTRPTSSTVSQATPPAPNRPLLQSSIMPSSTSMTYSPGIPKRDYYGMHHVLVILLPSCCFPSYFSPTSCHFFSLLSRNHQS